MTPKATYIEILERPDIRHRHERVISSLNTSECLPPVVLAEKLNGNQVHRSAYRQAETKHGYKGFLPIHRCETAKPIFW